MTRKELQFLKNGLKNCEPTEKDFEELLQRFKDQCG